MEGTLNGITIIIGEIIVDGKIRMHTVKEVMYMAKETMHMDREITNGIINGRITCSKVRINGIILIAMNGMSNKMLIYNSIKKDIIKDGEFTNKYEVLDL